MDTPNEVARLRRIIENQAAALNYWRRVYDQDANRYRTALMRVRQGYANILEFRKLANSDRYGALTRDEIKAVLAEVDTALNPFDCVLFEPPVNDKEALS